MSRRESICRALRAPTDARLDELRENYLGLRREVIAQKSRLTNALSRAEYERLLFLADCGVSGNEFFSTSNREQAGAIRERGMTDAVIWTLERSNSKPKAIVWTHNLHAAKDSFRMPELAEGRLEPMGIRLRHALGESYLAFGGTFGSGTFPANLPPGGRVFEARGDEVMDGALSRVGTRNYLLDLRSVESSSAPGRWLRMERAWIAQDSDALLRSNEAFDAVYYVSRISRAQPTPRALRRFAMLLGNP